MWTTLRVVGHKLRGRKLLYQYYTNVTWRTCAQCLGWHGCIRPRPEAFADPQDGCPRQLLSFPVRELGAHRAKARRMADAARRELQRRSWFREAEATLHLDAERALGLLRQSGEVDVYLPEVERLVERHRNTLAADPKLRDEVRAVLLSAWREKFSQPRYERLPERMRLEHEKGGAHYIEALLDEQ